MTCQQRARELLNYEPETGVFTWKRRPGNERFNTMHDGKRAGTVVDGYVIIRFDGKGHQAHRLAWLLCHGTLPEGSIRHVDGDRSNNRISNLYASGAPPATCTIDGCGKGTFCRGLCAGHYTRYRTYGNPIEPLKVAEKGAREAVVRDALESSTDECITFGDCDTYFDVRIDGVIWAAHRYVCHVTHGPAPDGKPCVAHAPIVCHNRGCVNPRHLRWASHQENHDDCLIDGARPLGSARYNSKLSEDDVRMIRASSLPTNELARTLKVSRGTVMKARRGDTWTHIE